jgi:hypothetical protein
VGAKGQARIQDFGRKARAVKKGLAGFYTENFGVLL